MSGPLKLETQLTENDIVALLDGPNVVFTFLGPLVVRWELGEAPATVRKRLHYMAADIEHYDLKGESEQQRESLAHLQQVQASPRQGLLGRRDI
uniref:Uncharacterized protein n=1 Tax=Suricata suricatta TaxID=37032 RepID=A0A673TRR6_SURSU